MRAHSLPPPLPSQRAAPHIRTKSSIRGSLAPAHCEFVCVRAALCVRVLCLAAVAVVVCVCARFTVRLSLSLSLPNCVHVLAETAAAIMFASNADGCSQHQPVRSLLLLLLLPVFVCSALSLSLSFTARLFLLPARISFACSRRLCVCVSSHIAVVVSVVALPPLARRLARRWQPKLRLRIIVVVVVVDDAAAACHSPCHHHRRLPLY